LVASVPGATIWELDDEGRQEPVSRRSRARQQPDQPEAAGEAQRRLGFIDEGEAGLGEPLAQDLEERLAMQLLLAPA
jgi:hypothetical protein